MRNVLERELSAIGGLVQALILNPVPDIITFSESELRAALWEAGGNCSDSMGRSCSQPVFPGLTRNPETFATSNGHYHWHFWIPAFGDI